MDSFVLDTVSAKVRAQILARESADVGRDSREIHVKNALLATMAKTVAHVRIWLV